jgi:cysteine-rich repeat protein
MMETSNLEMAAEPPAFRNLASHALVAHLHGETHALKFAGMAKTSDNFLVTMEIMSMVTGKLISILFFRCSFDCQIELGFDCTGGNFTHPDKCQEFCGDGLLMSETRPNVSYCDDGNLDNGDGCNSSCSIEIGYTCSGGSQEQPDSCFEICGDGINSQNIGCDDGNTLDSDG